MEVTHLDPGLLVSEAEPQGKREEGRKNEEVGGVVRTRRRKKSRKQKDCRQARPGTLLFLAVERGGRPTGPWDGPGNSERYEDGRRRSAVKGHRGSEAEAEAQVLVPVPVLCTSSSGSGSAQVQAGPEWAAGTSSGWGTGALASWLQWRGRCSPELAGGRARRFLYSTRGGRSRDSAGHSRHCARGYRAPPPAGTCTLPCPALPCPSSLQVQGCPLGRVGTRVG